jgi:hypothetical protein
MGNLPLKSIKKREIFRFRFFHRSRVTDQKGRPERCLSSHPPKKPYSLIFLSPRRERIEVRGNDPRTFFHPHPDPLPSREREIEVMFLIGGLGRIKSPSVPLLQRGRFGVGLLLQRGI